MGKRGPRAATHCKDCNASFEDVEKQRSRAYCVDCHRKYQREFKERWRKENPEEYRATVKRFQELARRGEIKQHLNCKTCGTKLEGPAKPSKPWQTGWKCKKCHSERMKEWARKNPEKVRRTRSESNSRMRKKTFEHYGESCSCCGEDLWEFLTLDHAYNDGSLNREETRVGGVGFYTRLSIFGFPEGFQTLCMNCNSAKGWYGYCPHALKNPRGGNKYVPRRPDVPMTWLPPRPTDK